jgi:indole-3-glycerol phosphate synthase
MATRLDEIIAVARKRVEQSKIECPLAEISRQAEQMKSAPRGFRKALLSASQDGGIAIIAELKKASPSKGVIRGTFHVGGLAMQLEKAGAAALSVLTEEKFFDGSLGNLQEASAAADLPCLRKDFIVDVYQVYESRINRADAILLIVAALGQQELEMLHRKARELGLDVLCEVHDESELERAVAIGADIIGVNSRNLKTLQVDPELHHNFAAKLPRNVLRVAESGIQSGSDIRRLRALDAGSPGYQAFLIGETLMMADDPGQALAELIAASKAPPIGGSGIAVWTAGTKD